MKSKHLYSILSISIIIFLAFSFNNDESGDKKIKNDKLINFSHNLHSELAECSDCHNKVSNSETLDMKLLPNHDNCSECHDVEDDENCSTCHIDDNFEPLIQSESDLIFNHKFHINNQDMKCEQCHKGISEVNYSYESPHAHPDMATCNNCHDNFKGKATNECSACHKSTVNLIPENHQSSNFIKTHKFIVEEEDANCMMCHDNTSCQDCHTATTALTEANTNTDFYAPYSPHNYSTSGAEKQKLNKVHDLNFRFTHGIEARGKTSECQTCHQVETFCAECHNAEGGDYALSGMRPASHFQSGFTTFGAGSGGGEHAVLAKRDLESCVACHDTQGNDPTCITCHHDFDGIKGNNAKTHPNNFMRDVHGDWHDSQGSICYNCHTSASPSTPPGIGFCGYCHSSK